MKLQKELLRLGNKMQKYTYKHVILVLFPIVSIALLWFYISSSNQSPYKVENTKAVPLNYKDNTIQCPQCNMFIVGKKDTAQIITTDHKTHFFDDVGCAILWLEEKKIDLENVKFWVYTRDTKEYIQAQDAFYSLVDETPMRYGFGAYKNIQDSLVPFGEMRLKMLRGENLSDPKIRKKLLGY
jgi:hypothetical protein